DSSHLVDEVFGAACKIGQPGLHRPALAAAWRAGEFSGGEERRALPAALGQALDHLLAWRVKRDHLDGAGLGIRIVNPEPRLLGRGHARAFAGHRRSPGIYRSAYSFA